MQKTSFLAKPEKIHLVVVDNQSIDLACNGGGPCCIASPCWFCAGACCMGGGGGICCCSCSWSSRIFCECSAMLIFGTVTGWPWALFLIASLTIFIISTCICSFSSASKFLRIRMAMDAKDKSRSSSGSSDILDCVFSNIDSIALCIAIRCFAAAVILLDLEGSCRWILLLMFVADVDVDVDGTGLPAFCCFWKSANSSFCCISWATRLSGGVVTDSVEISWTASTPSSPAATSTDPSSSSSQLVSRL